MWDHLTLLAKVAIEFFRRGLHTVCRGVIRHQLSGLELQAGCMTHRLVDQHGLQFRRHVVTPQIEAAGYVDIRMTCRIGLPFECELDSSKGATAGPFEKLARWRSFIRSVLRRQKILLDALHFRFSLIPDVLASYEYYGRMPLSGQ